MSNERDDPPGNRNRPGRMARWLQSFAPARPARGVGQVRLVSSAEEERLLKKAAICYVTAGWDEDACRLFEHLNIPTRAAYHHERLGRWEQAANCYARVGRWSNAARCYLNCNRPVEAAACLLRDGQSLLAAWYLADLAHQFIRARSIVSTFRVTSPADECALNLIVARCLSGTGAPAEAARRLRSVLEWLSQGPAKPDLIEWALSVAQALRRPDMTALVYAAAVNSGALGAGEKWQRWAAETLGTEFILPLREHVESEAAS